MLNRVKGSRYHAKVFCLHQKMALIYIYIKADWCSSYLYAILFKGSVNPDGQAELKLPRDYPEGISLFYLPISTSKMLRYLKKCQNNSPWVRSLPTAKRSQNCRGTIPTVFLYFIYRFQPLRCLDMSKNVRTIHLTRLRNLGLNNGRSVTSGW